MASGHGQRMPVPYMMPQQAVWKRCDEESPLLALRNSSSVAPISHPRQPEGKKTQVSRVFAPGLGFPLLPTSL